MICRTAAIVVFMVTCGIVIAADPDGVQTWRVVSVHDGDCLTGLDANNTQHKARLLGIDAPERGQPLGSVNLSEFADSFRGG
jgi:endonuclease YncB( thermonuclease family)